MEEFIAGVDLGGTNVRIAIAEKQKPTSFVHYASTQTPVRGGPGAFLGIVREALDAGMRELGVSRAKLSGLGCTIPGIVDADEGIALLVTNLPGWDNYPIRDRLVEALEIPVAIENDVNAAALGEFWYGEGQDARSIVYFTISTGIAAGIVIEGKLLRGANQAAGEMGFFVPDPRHIESMWEPNGCLELTSAGVGLVKAWRERKGGDVPADITAIDVFEAATKGDEDALAVVELGANYLAQAVIALSTIIDPEKIILSGSIVQHQAFVFDRICAMTKKQVPHAPEIILSSFKGDAPLIGALAIAAGIKE